MAKIAGKDATLKYGSPQVTVAQIRSIGSIDCGSETIDVTCLDSTGNYREYIQGFLTTGELSITLIWDNSLTSHDGLADLYESGAETAFEISLPFTSAQAFTFNGFVSGWTSPAATVDGPLESTIKIKPTGKITRT